jgi:hypothetical protein
MNAMADDLLSVLARFHREVVLPDIRTEISVVRGEIGDLRRELSHFDAIYARFDRLESVHRSVAATVARMERAA